MTDTMIVWGRYWYDSLTLGWIVGFFLIEMLLLFRRSVIGWAMTAKCLALAFVFWWALKNPPPVLPPENVTIESVTVRAVLIIVLGVVIGILIYMRIKRLTVFVGKEGSVQ